MKTCDRNHTGISARAGWWIFAIVMGGAVLIAALDLADGRLYHSQHDVTSR